MLSGLHYSIFELIARFLSYEVIISKLFSALLLVALGNDPNLSANSNPFNSCEVINMANSGTSCRNFPNYPKTLMQAAGQVLDSIPIIIGGYSPYVKDVYKFDKIANSWKQLGSLTNARSMHTSVIMNGGIWIIGGYNSPGKRTEIIYSNGTITAGKVLLKKSCGK